MKTKSATEDKVFLPSSQLPYFYFLCDASHLNQHRQNVITWMKSNGLADCVLVETLLKGLRMVIRALWRSEARRVVPWSETLHGHSRYQSHFLSTQCTHHSHCLRQQWRHNSIQPHDVTITKQRTLLWAHVNETEIGVKSALEHISKFRLYPALVILTGDPLHSRALVHSRAPLFTQLCPHCSHSRAPGEQWARLCMYVAGLCASYPAV